MNESVQISQQKWVQWKHEQYGIFHCGTCLALHGCWFVWGKEPLAPLHEKCHCITISIPASQVKNRAKATSAFSKFDPYLFNTFGLYSHGKEKLFASWGYSVADSEWLQEEIEKQGRQQYLLGNYELAS